MTCSKAFVKDKLNISTCLKSPQFDIKMYNSTSQKFSKEQQRFSCMNDVIRFNVRTDNDWRLVAVDFSTISRFLRNEAFVLVEQ